MLASSPDPLSAPYPCHRTLLRPPGDGRLEHPAWRKAPRSPRFVDMVTGGPAFYDTRAAALWDDEALYVAFWVEEPFPQATLARRDSIVFLENDVEVFVDGGDCYYELEVNALGTVYEVLFVWKDAYRRGSRFDVPELSLLDRDVLTFGGDYDRTGPTFWRGTHPRGTRWAFLDWDFPGLETAVHVDGRLNDPTVVSRGWRVELAFPWKGMGWLAGRRPVPPREGDVWRMFFGRFQKLAPGGTEISPHPAWCWTPHGVYDTHQPERWTAVRFTERPVDGPASRGARRPGRRTA